MAQGYIPIDDPPGAAPLPPGSPAPGLKSGPSSAAARSVRTAPAHRSRKMAKPPKRRLSQRRRSA